METPAPAGQDGGTTARARGAVLTPASLNVPGGRIEAVSLGILTGVAEDDADTVGNEQLLTVGPPPGPT